MSRSSTPELPPQDLWSSILDSVSQSRSIPAKQVLILGQPSSGKSILASALLQKPLSDDPSEANLPDFALGYDWADVRDEGDEGKTTLFRSLSVVTLKQIFFESRHLGTIICLYCAIIRYDLYLFVARFPAATTIITAYSRDHCPRLDAPVDLYRRVTDLAGLGRTMGEGRWLTRARDRPGRAAGKKCVCNDVSLEHGLITVGYQCSRTSSIILNIHLNPSQPQPIQAHYFH